MTSRVDVGLDDDDLAVRRGRLRRAESRQRRVRALVVAVALALVAALFGLAGSLLAPPDFDGPGTGSVVVEVRDGASTTEIGGVLERAGVVASSAAFTRAASDEPQIRAVQPGFYRLRSAMSGESAVALMLDPAARVGRLEIRGGVQLDDTRSPDGKIAPGVLSLIARATCVDPDGPQRCLTADDLRAAMVDTDPAELGVPAWALEPVRAAEPTRRLEGLLLPGLYDLEPGTSPVELLRRVVGMSAARLEASGLVAGAKAVGYSSYDVLVVASLVEKEGITADMPKVARVVYNRLAAGQRLELDSTVNYPLDIQALRTTPEARDHVGPYNSYRTAKLPPTPIGAPGRAAVAAAVGPVPGPWLFFVRCQRDGTSCFGETLVEHQANVRAAIENGAF